MSAATTALAAFDLTTLGLSQLLGAGAAYAVLLYVALAFWMVRDARLRSASVGFAALAAALGLLLPFLGAVVYFVIRPPRTLDDERALVLEASALTDPPVEPSERPCPACGRDIEREFVVCPYCRTQFARRCHGCKRWLRLGWHVCPYCAEEIGVPTLGGGTGRAASS